MKHDHSAKENLAMRVSAQTLAVNFALSAGKLAVGLLAHSGALVSDAIHSASDAFSTIIVMLGIRAAEQDPDRKHPYGHERFECVYSLALALLLAGAGLLIGRQAIEQILGNAALPIPGAAALAAAAVSVLVKEGMYHYTMRAAREVHSVALKADAWHHRSDALSSIGSFAGILGARMGAPKLDAAASLVICLFILKVAYEILRESLAGMVDTACDEETVSHMRNVILEQPGVLGIDLLNTRIFGAKIYVDVEIRADGGQTLESAHAIAERVHRAIEEEFEEVKHCMVHVNPTGK